MWDYEVSPENLERAATLARVDQAIADVSELLARPNLTPKARELLMQVRRNLARRKAAR